MGSNFIGRELYSKESKGLGVGDIFKADGTFLEIISPNAVWPVKGNKVITVYVHSWENGVFQVGKTCYQPCTNSKWTTSMSGCGRENRYYVKASTPEDAIRKVIEKGF